MGDRFIFCLPQGWDQRFLLRYIREGIGVFVFNSEFVDIWILVKWSYFQKYDQIIKNYIEKPYKII